MNKTTKYLPLHPSMRNFLKNGMTVIHNGKTSRRGNKGFISGISGGTIFITYSNPRIRSSQNYSIDWFMENFYIICSDILGMKGFKGKGYFDKYKHLHKTPSELTKIQPKHCDNKTQVEHCSVSCLKKIRDTALFMLGSPLIEEKEEEPLIDPLDEVGEFIVLEIKSGKICGKRRTQRLAELLADSLYKEKKGKYLITKVVSELEVVETTKFKR